MGYVIDKVVQEWVLSECFGLYPDGIVPQIFCTPSFGHKKFFFNFSSLFLLYVRLSRAEPCRRGSDICSAAVIPFTVVSSPAIKKKSNTVC